MRLPAILPYAILILVGTAICSIGYERKWDWKIIVILGYGMIGWQVSAALGDFGQPSSALTLFLRLTGCRGPSDGHDLLA